MVSTRIEIELAIKVVTPGHELDLFIDSESRSSRILRVKAQGETKEEALNSSAVLLEQKISQDVFFLDMFIGFSDPAKALLELSRFLYWVSTGKARLGFRVTGFGCASLWIKRKKIPLPTPIKKGSTKGQPSYTVFTNQYPPRRR